MNSRVIRNLALIGLMGGALYALNGKPAYARDLCYQCSQEENVCYSNACGYSANCPPQPQCQAAYEECLATCTN